MENGGGLAEEPEFACSGGSGGKSQVGGAEITAAFAREYEYSISNKYKTLFS